MEEEIALALGARCTHLPPVSAFKKGAEQMRIFILVPTRALHCISLDPALTAALLTSGTVMEDINFTSCASEGVERNRGRRGRMSTCFQINLKIKMILPSFHHVFGTADI